MRTRHDFETRFFDQLKQSMAARGGLRFHFRHTVSIIGIFKEEGSDEPGKVGRPAL